MKVTVIRFLHAKSKVNAANCIKSTWPMLLPICFQSVVYCVAQAFFHYQLESSHKLGRGNSFPGLDKRYFILVYSEPEWQDIAGKKAAAWPNEYETRL